jgi:hemerythrin-like domain-containing protein
VTPFQYLGNEHRELSRMLAVLEKMAEVVATGADVDRSDLDAVMDYFREVGDMSHHDKEETLLVPALVRQNMDWFHGPLAELRRDHRQERYLMRSLRHAARQTRDWSEEDKRHFVSLVRSYIDFMRAHFTKENEQWFVEAARRLPPEEQAALLASFEKFDAEMAALPGFAALKQRALNLIEKYGTS